MSSKPTDANSIKRGSYILVNGEPCEVLSLRHCAPGKHGPAKIRMEVIGLFDKKKRSVLMPASSKVQTPIVDKRIGQVITLEGDELSIMDKESFETLSIPKPVDSDLLEKLETFISNGKTCEVDYWIVMSRYLINRIREAKL